MTAKDPKPRPLDEGAWFVPKRYGVGASPATWQGWLATAVYAALLAAALRFLPNISSKAATGIGLTSIFFVMSILKTDGGWGWHWGDRDGR